MQSCAHVDALSVALQARPGIGSNAATAGPEAPSLWSTDVGFESLAAADAAAVAANQMLLVTRQWSEVPDRLRAVEIQLLPGSLLGGNGTTAPAGAFAPCKGCIGLQRRLVNLPSAAQPEWWGARGDGVADDTAAVQAAIDTGSCALSAQRVYSVTSLVVQGRNDMQQAAHIIGNYAVLRARPTTAPVSSLLSFASSAQFSYVSGPLSIDMNYELGCLPSQQCLDLLPLTLQPFGKETF